MPQYWNTDGTPVIMQGDGSDEAFDERQAQWQKPSGNQHVDLSYTEINPRLTDPAPGPPDNRGPDPSAYGRIIRIVDNATGLPTTSYDGIVNQFVNAIWTPIEKKACVWTVTISVQIPITAVDNPPIGFAGYRLTWTVGGVNFQKVGYIAGHNIGGSFTRRFPIQARQVQVDVFEVCTPGSYTRTFTLFSVSVEKGELNSPQFTCPAWYVAPGDAGVADSKYIISPNAPGLGALPLLAPFAPGIVQAMTGTLLAQPTPGALLYPMCFDNVDAVIPPGQFPIAGSVGPPIVNVGDSFSFGDDTDPQAGFQNGLVAALSTSPIAYTAPAAGTKFFVQVKVGQ